MSSSSIFRTHSLGAARPHMIKFRPIEEQRPAAGRLLYEHSCFVTEPRPRGCATSISIPELELTIDDEDQRVVSVQGYCPNQTWIRTALGVPASRRASLQAVPRKPLAAGKVKARLPDGRWSAFVDTCTGWVRLGNVGSTSGEDSVQFAPGAVAVLDGERLVALWLHPEKLPLPQAEATPELANRVRPGDLPALERWLSLRRCASVP